MSLLSDPRWGEALTHLPDYLGNHVRVSVTALALGLAVSLPLAILSRNRPVLRTALLGLASVVQTVPGLALLTGGVCAAGLYLSVLYAAWEGLFFFHGLTEAEAPSHRSARTMWHLLREKLMLRVGLVAAATVCGVLAVLLPGVARAVSVSGFFLLTFGSAVVERYCFFTASDAPRMPGGISS